MNEKELNEYVGNRIREERKKKRLTQGELGELIGVKHNTISAYEKGRNAPEQNAIFKIALALDVKVDDLFPAKDHTRKLHNSLEDLDNLNLDISDMAFLKQLINQAATLKGADREKFMDNMRLAVEFFNKSNKSEV